MIEGSPYFERHVARLLIVLYFCGATIHSLLDGETRQVESLWRLQLFDFWVREPGHLALALLHGLTTGALTDHEAIRTLIDRTLADAQADVRRVGLPGAPYNVLENFDESLSFLTSRALLSDRPSFGKGRGTAHQVVLETAGIGFVDRLLTECPLFNWYRIQAESVAQFFPMLEKIDLAVMPYLAPELTPAQAASVPLIPFIAARAQQVFAAPMLVTED